MLLHRELAGCALGAAAERRVDGDSTGSRAERLLEVLHVEVEGQVGMMWLLQLLWLVLII